LGRAQETEPMGPATIKGQPGALIEATENNLAAKTGAGALAGFPATAAK